MTGFGGMICAVWNMEGKVRFWSLLSLILHVAYLVLAAQVKPE